MQPRVIFAALLFFSAVTLSHAAPKKKQHSDRQGAAQFQPSIHSSFSRWDGNQDGKVDFQEINVQIRNPQARGPEAAALVVLRKYFAASEDDKDDSGRMEAELVAIAGEKNRQQDFSKTLQRIQNANRALFLPGDPDIKAIDQGGKDCYFMSSVASFATRHPQQLKSMFQQLPGGELQIRFASGQIIKVSPLTEAELVMGAKTGTHHGTWLNALQKAYAVIRYETKEKRGKDVDLENVVARELLALGRPGPVMSDLTGHRSDSFKLAKSYKEKPTETVRKTHETLTRLEAGRRLMCVMTSKGNGEKLPRGIAHGHVFAVLGYNTQRQMVKVFNPWNNNIKPKGAPGLANGYLTQNGVFEMPVQEFAQVFNELIYETDKPLGK